MTCVCVLGGRDSCMCTTNIDQPVCQFCEAAKHHEREDFTPTIKEVGHAGPPVHVV